jgi:methionine synthase II (cobalamin-independent)
MAQKLHRCPPFRAEHLGSCLRPDNLKDAREKFNAGQASLNDIEPATESAIKQIVDIQLKLDYHAITDGEYRRHQFWGNWFPSLIGMEPIYDPPLDMFRLYVPDLAAFTEEGKNPGESIVCKAKIKHPGADNSVYVPELKYLQSLVPKERWGEIKLTLPAPEWYHLRYKDGHAFPSDVYASDSAYFADIAAAYREELRILYAAGLRNAQIDDPNMAYFCSEKMRAAWPDDKANTKTVDELFESYIGLYNACLADRPDDLHVGLHLCRGNFVGSRHFSEGGYDVIAKTLFNRLNVDTYYLEYDTERAGTFEPLLHLPAHKNAILGVVTSKFPKLEDPKQMCERVYGAADVIAKGDKERGDGPGGEAGAKEALKRLGVSPQCGFASHESGNALGWDDMVNKLKLVKKIAAEIWPGEP